jgi:hypothetical protein
MNTLLLNTANWDLTVTSSGDIAMATEPYAIAQDVASALKLFQGELYYDTTQGVPYFEQILGKYPPAQYLKAQFVLAAMTVPGVASAKAFLTGFSNRQLSGQVQITDANGQTSVVSTADVLDASVPWYISAVSPQAAGSLEGGA